MNERPYIHKSADSAFLMLPSGFIYKLPSEIDQLCTSISDGKMLLHMNSTGTSMMVPIEESEWDETAALLRSFYFTGGTKIQ